MKRLAMIVALCAGPLAADPLDLIDYEALFVQNATDVEEATETRSLLRVGDVILIRDPELPRTYAGLDESILCIFCRAMCSTLGVCSFYAPHSFQYAWCSCDDFLVSVRKWC